MKKYIVFLRGINVSGQKMIKMADLKLALAPEFETVITYIQSGNLVVESGLSPLEIQQKIGAIIQKKYAFEVPVIVISSSDLKTILDNNPFKNQEEKNLYFCLLKEKPDSDIEKRFKLLAFENEEFYMTAKCIYLNCYKGYGRAKLNNNYVEQKLKVEATTRNLKTMLKMLELSA
ncbi:DUF1697 domain-containing protein [Croceivirga sp. JEA036]|uniref:DUF1697 domain-containing protein n=1 Tax=Croceivirga sp. JEA036 TaxID=2721162 RepID=UPI00143C3E8C|nr:DUF1697 domain-containing protein [Croceivirga sp. JEA036]NJB36729.1 DUF1697 domain-containing protein [Croceivirga sp. JEA036]